MSSFNEEPHNKDSITKAGYKQTEVGIIPSDWEVKKLREISPSQSVGLVINPSSYYDDRGSIPMLVGSHVEENKITWESANRITKDSNAKLPASRLYSGDLVTVRVGAPGITAVIPQELDQANCASMMIIRQGDKFDSNWLCFMMNSFIGRTRIEGVQYGTAQKQFNIIDAIDFLFPFPKKTEQTAIANALSDVDALIQELEKLIAKKQAIKTATMQQLLTGRTRLPRFAHHPDGRQKGYKPSELGEIPEDWEVYSIFQSTDCLDNLRVPLNEQQRMKMVGEIPYCGANGIVGWVNDFVIDDDIILMAEDGGYFDEYSTRPIAYRIQGKCWVNNHAHILKAKDSFDQGYIFYSLVHKDIQKYLASGTRAKLNKSEMEKIEIIAPMSKLEQSALSSILVDIDREVEALEQRLSKTRQIKQGMMQKLLTGKTRLVKPAGSA